MVTSQAQKMTNETESLYLVNLKYKTAGVGGGSMVLQLAVDPANGTLNGKANGTIDEGTQHAPSFMATVSGHTYRTGLGNVTRIGEVSGQAIVSVPPPAIGSYLAPFSASLAVDQDWTGTGKFSVGDKTYECEVSKAS